MHVRAKLEIFPELTPSFLTFLLWGAVWELQDTTDGQTERNEVNLSSPVTLAPRLLLYFTFFSLL
jgi:hypothetical protein